MHSPRFLGRVRVDRFEDKTQIILIFRQSQHVIFHIVCLYLHLPLGKHDVPVLIQSQLLLFPSFYIEASRKTDIVQYTIERRDGGFEVILDELADISNCSHVILALFLPTQAVEGFHVLFRNFFFAILVLHLHFIVGVEIPARGVFAVIEDGGERVGEVEGGPEGLFFCKFLEKIELAHLYR